MYAREFYNKLGYTNQIQEARNLLCKASRLTKEEVANMSDLDVCQELLKRFVYISEGYNGEDILLIKKEHIGVFNSIASWLRR